MAVGILLGLALIAGQTETECRQIGGTTRCTTQTTPSINWGAQRTPDFAGSAMSAYEAGRRARAERDAAIAAAQQQQMSDAEVESYKRAGSLIRQGKCQQARDEALAEGNLLLAKQIKDVCD